MMEESHQRELKGIWIPIEIWDDENLTRLERDLWAEIFQLDGEEGCVASNEYLAKVLRCDKCSVTKGISKLKKLGYIFQESFDGRVRVLRSSYRLQVSVKSSRQSREKSVGRVDEKQYAGSVKSSSIEYNIENRLEYNLDNSNNTSEIKISDGSRKKELPKEAYNLAEHLKDKILEHQPTACINRNYRESWAKDFEKAHRLDKRDWNKMFTMIDFCFDVSDFWGPNIRSGAKLRQHYDQIESQIQRYVNKNGTIVVGQGDIDYSSPLF